MIETYGRFETHHFKVTQDSYEYHEDIEEREEGGTPAIVESIRAGMVFQVKDVRIKPVHISSLKNM